MVAARLFHDDDEPRLALREHYEYTLKTKSGDVVCHNYSTPSHTPDSPAPKPHFRVVGDRTPTPKDKEQAKSVALSPSRSKIRRNRSPPIKRPLGQYESSEEKTPKGPSVAQLVRTILEMHKEHKKLSDQVAKSALELKALRMIMRLFVTVFAPR
ncbi:hypothetical protein PAHAL_2G198800 [Panicum hallii]|jgi:hypothetical protein|uniref:Uncharacterized protein n=1 Tax=Panicum hallii TaxID=206008 RepID=A0A2T8KPM7_9POAL|nr:hypothetical protein PAHAL_2G198800 [Panicum hallii]